MLKNLWISIDYKTLDDYRSGVHILYGSLFMGRGISAAFEYQYVTSNGLYYGAQISISYADGLKYRIRTESTWHNWITL